MKTQTTIKMADNIPYFSYIFSAFVGIGLAASSGFRIFMPLFAVSLASYMGWIPVNDNFQWIAGLPTLITTGIAMIVEVLAYYIPYVDHLLDTLLIPLATIAGTVLFASQYTDLGTFPTWALAIIAGGSTAAAISAGFASTRMASTATTGGIGNSAVATTEAAGAGVMTFLSLAAPTIAVIMALVLIIVFFVVSRKLWRRLKKNPNTKDHNYFYY